jgi:hypothetical protein
MMPSVLLVGANGNRLELTVAGYQFPTIEPHPWDSNWLNITVDVLNEHGAWTATDPSLATVDIAHLADWFDSVAEDRVEDPEIFFLELTIIFRLQRRSGDDVALRVWFQRWFRPPWAPNEGWESDVWVDLDVTTDDVRRAARDLREHLHEFPPPAGVRPGKVVSHVGDDGLRDGVVVAVSQDGSDARVQVRGGNGDRFEVCFSGVASISEHRAAGMRIYALAEMTGKPPLRRFVFFAHWDEPDDATLEVDAMTVAFEPLPG